MNARAQGSLVQELTLHPTIIGKIKLGVQVLTPTTRKNQKAVEIYRDGVSAGLPFSKIESRLFKECSISNGMMPENTEYFSLCKSDFTDPASVDLLTEKYGEDRDGTKRIYRIPVVFPYGDALEVMPHRFAAYTASALVYFSEYHAGTRYCNYVSQPVPNEQAQRVTRSFGRSRIEIRKDDEIDGICNPEGCSKFQNKGCKLELKLHCSIPGLKGAGLVQIHTTSIYSLRQWYSTLEFVQKALGSIRNKEFFITKKLVDTTYLDKNGALAKSKTWITVLNSTIDIPEMLAIANQDSVRNIRRDTKHANQAAALLENSPSEYLYPKVLSDQERTQRFELFQQYLKDVESSDRSPLDKAICELKAYLKYLNVNQTNFDQYASRKHGENWSQSLKAVKAEIAYVSISTESEMRAVLASSE